MSSSAIAASFLLICAVQSVAGVDLYGEGSHLHHEQTAGAPSHQYQREPAWKHVTPLRTEAAFYAAIRREALSLVFFYALWSQPSMDMALDVDRQAEILAEKRPVIPVFAINLQELKNLARDYRVNGVPNFAVFRFGHLAPLSEQMVPRYALGIAAYMHTLLKDSVTRLTTEDAARAIVDPKHRTPIARSKPGLLPVVTPHPDDEFAKSVTLCFTAEEQYIANINDAARLLVVFFAVFHIDNNKIRTLYDARDDTCVVYRRWGDKTPLVFELRQEPHLNKIFAEWLAYNAVAPMQVFNEESQPIYSMRHKPLLIYFSIGRLPSTDPFFDVMSRISDDPSLNVTTAQCDPNAAGKYVAHFLGLDGATLSVSNKFAIGLLIGRKKYRFNMSSAPPTEENLRAFVVAAKENRWPEFFKSERASKVYPRGSGRVSDLAFIDFEKIVINDTQNDTLILVYRPDDRNSKRLMPILDELAKQLRNAAILIGRYNILENDYEDHYAVPGVPVIFYAKRTDKLAPVKLDGVARTVDNLKAFVAEHATVSLSSLSPSDRVPTPVEAPSPASPSRSQKPDL